MNTFMDSMERFANSQAPWLMLFVSFLAAVFYFGWKQRLMENDLQREARESDKQSHLLRQAKLDEIHSELRADAVRDRALLLGIIQKQSELLDKINDTQSVIQEAVREIQYDTKKARLLLKEIRAKGMKE